MATELGETRVYVKQETEETKFYEQQTSNFRERSGAQVSNSPLVTFFYQLMRDSMTAGEVEVQVRTALWAHNQGKQGKVVFTNGYLAQHARDICGAPDFYEAAASESVTRWM